MRKSTRQAKTAAKAKLSGAIQASDVPKNKKIVFDDNDVSDADDSQHVEEGGDDLEQEVNESDDAQEDADQSDDENVEEVTGSAARESTKKLRDAERKMAKDSAVPKKKRKKNVVVAKPTDPDEGSDIDDEDEGDDLLTDDFLAMVDSERADQLQKAKQDKKKRKLQEKKRLGKHTTFVVDDDYKMIDAPQKMSQNIEVVALGGGVGTDADDIVDDHSRQHLISATIGTAPSKAAIAFARGSLSSGTSMARGSSGKKRTSKKEETWKRSRKMNSLAAARSRTGNAAAFFIRKR